MWLDLFHHFYAGFTAGSICMSYAGESYQWFGKETMGYPILISIAGILLYALAKVKVYDELFRQLRLESMQLTIFIIYLFRRDFEVDPSYLLNLQIIGFLLIYWVKKNAFAVYQ